jgi:hypothetical protein
MRRLARRIPKRQRFSQRIHAMTPELKAAYAFHRAAKVSTTGGPHDYPTPRNGYAAVAALHRARYDIDTGKRRHGAPERAYVTPQPDSDLTHVSDPSAFGLRLIGKVETESYGGRDCWNEHDSEGGWFTDPFGDVFRDGTGLCYGVVYALAGRGGLPRFVAGYEMGGYDSGVTLNLRDIFTGERGGAWDSDPKDQEAAREAACRADDMARRAAEEERAYQAAWQAGRRYADCGEELDAARKGARELLAERRALRGTAGFPAVCTAIASTVAAFRATMRKMREERAALAAGNGTRNAQELAFWTGDAGLRDAFNDGAGKAVLA